MGEQRKILVLGAGGQIGTDLVSHFRELLGTDNVMASDIREPNSDLASKGLFETLDVLDAEKCKKLVNDFQPTGNIPSRSNAFGEC